jgi:hypothetical protein
VSKPKPKAEPTSKPTAAPKRSFAGAWTGSTACSMSDGSTSSTVWSIKISDDEKTVLIDWHVSGEAASGPELQAPCIRFGSALSWSLKQLGDSPTWACTDTLQLNGNGTANYVRQGSFIAGDNAGTTYTCTGALSREGVSLPPSGPQTTTTAASQMTPATATKNPGDLPTAKPVPNKPGFVYNPFDSNTKVLLDVRGKTAGTKVKDPFSGKLFIVP